MKTLKNAAVIVLGILIAAAIVLPAVAAPEWTPEQKEVIAVMEAWQKAWDGGDADKIGQLLADEVDMTSRTLGGNFKDKAMFIEAYKKWSVGSRTQPGLLSQYVTYQEVKISGDDASLVRKIDWTRTGGRFSSGTSIKSARLKKINGEWRIVSEK